MSEVLRRSEILKKEKTLRHLFDIITSEENKVAARYLDGDTEVTITNGEYKKKAFAVAAYLNKVFPENKRGSFLALQLDTCPEYNYLFWGIITGGFNAVLVDHNLNDTMTDYLLGQSGAIGLITAKKRSLQNGAIQIMAADLFNVPLVEIKDIPFGNMIALCTSGTTASSRIFVYNENAVCEQVLNSELIFHKNKRLISDAPTRSLSFLPLHHIFGFLSSILWMPFLRYENIYLHDRSPKTILKTAQRFQITHLMAVPMLANSLADSLEKKASNEKPAKRCAYKLMKGASLALQTIAPDKGLEFACSKLFKSITGQILGSSLRCIVLGGSHTPEKTMRTLSAIGYYAVGGFGMTETGINSFEYTNKLFKRTSGSVGKPLSSTEYRVIPNGSNPNEGELIVRSKTLHTGRLVDGVIREPLLDKDGWFHTGDIVRLSKDGRMFVQGRAKEVIINESGENVYPDEIEECFTGLENVKQFCVLGTPLNTKNQHKKSAKGTEYENITLVLSLGSDASNEACVQKLASEIKRINKTLPAVKRINRLLITQNAFETSGSMKIKRAVLRKSIVENAGNFREIDLNSVADMKTETGIVNNKTNEDSRLSGIKETVRSLYAETLQIPKDTIRDDSHFIDDLGGNSLQVLGMSIDLEEKLGILIDPEDFGKCTTINDLSELLLQRMDGKNETENTEPVKPITRFEDSPEYIAFQERIHGLVGDGKENPYFIAHDSPATDTSIMDGKRVLNFGSYNYVCMSGRKETKQAAKDAIDKYGTSASGSRLLGGEKSLHKELEREIADWKHTEDALVLVGGHSTNVTCVGNFCGKGDLIIYDAIAHNSVAQGCQLSKAVSRPFPHNDVKKLEDILRAQRDKYAKVLIIIEGVYSMDGDIAPVPEVVALKKKYGCFLMVDEAHSACCIGQTGGGVDEYFGLAPDDIDIKMGTLSKGLGACGGYLAGSSAIIEYMRYNLPGFVFSVGIAPPLAAEVLCAIRLLRSDPSIMADMRRNIKCFVEEAHKRNFNTCLAGETAIIPILVGKDEDACLLSNMLRKKGVFVPPALPPAVPRGQARLRFCVNSGHQPEQIIYALDMLEACAREAGIQLPPWQ